MIAQNCESDSPAYGIINKKKLSLQSYQHAQNAHVDMLKNFLWFCALSSLLMMYVPVDHQMQAASFKEFQLFHSYTFHPGMKSIFIGTTSDGSIRWSGSGFGINLARYVFEAGEHFWLNLDRRSLCQQ